MLLEWDITIQWRKRKAKYLPNIRVMASEYMYFVHPLVRNNFLSRNLKNFLNINFNFSLIFHYKYIFTRKYLLLQDLFYLKFCAGKTQYFDQVISGVKIFMFVVQTFGIGGKQILGIWKRTLCFPCFSYI